MVATAVVLLVCLSSVVRSDGPGDESSVVAVVKAMVEEQVAKHENDEIANQKATIAALTAALEAKQMDHAYVQLTTGGEVVELVSAAHVKALEKQIEACARRGDAQDAEIGTAVATVSKMRDELKEGRVPCGEGGHQLTRESRVTQAKLAAQEAQINELSATVAQLTRPMPVDAAGTAAARRLQDAGSSSPLPSCTHPSFDFETDAIDACPQGWACTGSASVQSEASAACSVTGVTGSHFFSVGCDYTLGSAVSSVFFLPLNVATMRFQRQGGADSPSGLYMFVAATDTLIAQSNEGSDTNQMFEVTLSLSAHAGETVYIEVKDEVSGGWGKVGYDAFRFYDAQGLLLDDSCMFSGPLPPPPPLPPPLPRPW